MRLGRFCLLTLTLFPLLRAEEPASDDQASVLDVTPGRPVLKSRDFFDQTGTLHPFVRMPRYVLADQRRIWTSPFHTSRSDIKWWILVGGATGALIAADKSIEKNLPQANNTFVPVSTGASRVGAAYTLIPVSAAFYFLGSSTHDERMRETGLLSFETLIDTTIAGEVFKIFADRSRPYQNDGKGVLRTIRLRVGVPAFLQDMP